MITLKPPTDVGRLVYGAGIVALALLCLAWGDFASGQAVPKDFPARTVLAYGAGGLMLLAGAAVMWRRTAVWGAGALAAYYGLIVVVLMDGRVILRHLREFIAYTNTAEQLAIATGAVMVFAAKARIEPVLTARLIRGSQMAFGVCAILFGAAHFAFMNLTAPLVPKWLPPSQLFWAYATGIGHIAAGLAILSGVRARLAAILLTAMYASFTLLVHLPMLLATPANRFIWSENATNLALIGVAWVVADSFGRPPQGA